MALEFPNAVAGARAERESGSMSYGAGLRSVSTTTIVSSATNVGATRSG